MTKRAYIKQAATELGIAEYSLRKMAKEGEIPCYRSGNRYIFDIAQCEEYLKNKAMENVKPIDEDIKYGVLRRVEVK
ncbi:helix-turn-helix domain-containing protein [Clostridium algidicarnis]|uniref:helix-turn-helix domain-containing protein n=1 Tax=Clostridium algidicarnis TaxID=37659 RepID=UPI001C0DE7E9|nr:helix-turn-helix domain-containing protein [Clostridium algidicarnis]MBU3203738.1 helix-turn-helix domain-containing protein [Clostridium algidicarnis]MBU3211892.1 helix-turn-helix domain-containing protein [Clostridium algidicarnis]MBU3221602.1 helix-turn-helix domain-containing protein [Clostridium algidicarnis]